MFKWTQVFLQFSKQCKGIPKVLRYNSNNFSSSSVVVEAKTVEGIDEKYVKRVTENTTKFSQKSENSIIAAAFASLQSDTGIKTPITDEKILNAQTIDELLSISVGAGVSRRHALKVVSVLADWSSSGKVKLSDFEGDPRFLRLCRILTKSSTNTYKNTSAGNMYSSRNEDLSTILSVTADDEAAKLVATISLPQMVKVMSLLSQKKRRSTLLLRSLAYNITKSNDRLNLKQSADLLYSMANLNFIDENLIRRVNEDVVACLEGYKDKSSVIGSIITSLGLLKYKEPGVLDTLSEWICKHHDICRTQDIFSLFLTLAAVNYYPANSEILYKTLVPSFKISDTSKPSEWLDLIWSLVLLNQANTEHISTVLSESFLGNFEKKSFSSCMKLLNIDAAASLMPAYNGPRISTDSSIRKTEITTTKHKEEVIKCLTDTIKNLIQNESCLRLKTDTGMGFLIDIECLIDKKCTPLPINDVPIAGQFRLAIMVHDYYDLCKGCVDLTGINAFIKRLLEARGYKVLSIPYTEFKPSDKLVNRVQYVESKLKEIVQS